MESNIAESSQQYDYFWQRESIAAFQDVVTNGGKGQLILPTGTGKTRIAIDMIAKHIDDEKRFGFYSIIVPRLLLSTQWLQEIAEQYLGKFDPQNNTISGGKKIPVSFVIVSTGKPSNDILDPIRECLRDILGGDAADAIVVTTSAQEVRSHVAMLQNENKTHVIAITSYHSSARLADATEILHDDDLQRLNTQNIGPVDICFFDEAHNLVTTEASDDDDFTQALRITANTYVSMTATPRKTDMAWDTTPDSSAKGMQNICRFGEVLYTKSPKEMVEAGAIVGPKMYLLGSADTAFAFAKRNNTTVKVQLCQDALNRTRNLLQEHSSAPEKVGAKVLVICEDQPTLKEIFGLSEGFKKFKPIFDSFKAQNPNLKVFGLSSDFGCYIDGDFYDGDASNNMKDKLLLRLRKLLPSDEAIIFHVDMIGEGLDVPGINAILPFRNCSKSKFQQTLGRAARLHPEDRKALERGTLKSTLERTGFIKPFCYVFFPYVYENRDDMVKDLGELLISLRDEWGFDPSEKITQSFSNPIPQPDDSLATEPPVVEKNPEQVVLQEVYVAAIENMIDVTKTKIEKHIFPNLTEEQIRKLILAAPPVSVVPHISFR
jgi:superfamily II DNA or RNA helicase